MKGIHEYFTVKFVNSASVSKTNICETINYIHNCMDTHWRHLNNL